MLRESLGVAVWHKRECSTLVVETTTVSNPGKKMVMLNEHFRGHWFILTFCPAIHCGRKPGRLVFRFHVSGLDTNKSFERVLAPEASQNFEVLTDLGTAGDDRVFVLWKIEIQPESMDR